MSIEELKREIKKAVDSASEPVLEEVFEYLREMINKPSDKVKTTRNLKKILAEDNELLQKLAE